MNVDRLIAAVQKETGIKLDAADPVLAAAAIYGVMMDDVLAKIEASSKGAANQITAAGIQNERSAKLAASDVITKASEWLGTRFQDAVQEATTQMLTELRKETAKSEASARVAVKAAWASGGAALVTLATLVGYSLAGL